MFKKRLSQAQISPLPSPAATNPHPPPPPQQSQRVMSGPQGQQGVAQPQPYRQGSYSDQQQQYPGQQQHQGQQQGSMRSQRSMSGQGAPGPGGRPDDFLAGPQYSGHAHANANGAPVERVISESQRSKMSEKSEKRRSGFFGFGRKKDKDKDEREKREHEEKEREVRTARPSFNVNRAETNLNPNQTQFQSPPPAANQFPDQGPGGGQGQYPQQMHRFPTPGGATPPLPPQGQQQNRMVSNPSPRPPGQGDDFGPSSDRRMPKSQTMGFSQPGRNGTPNGSAESHPYRGYLSGQAKQPDNERGYGQGLPKSVSMPHTALDKATPPTPPGENAALQPHGSPQLPGTAKDRTVSTGSVASVNAGGRTAATGPGAGAGQPDWMREFQAVVELIAMQPQKTYVASPPELEMIMARTSAGGQPKQGQPGSASNDWDAVWLQLSGISLSMWSMKETRAAAAKGEKVPPTYFNVTDSSLELLAPLPPPPHRPNSHPHHFVYSLNTAGSNRLLFSCPTEADIARWATGLRLAAWERARLEEIYTGHLIKSGGKEPRMDLQKGRMEGWVRVRIMGGTEWKRLWAVLSTPNPPPEPEDDKKNKRKSFFGMGSVKEEEPVIQEPNTGVPMASFYAEPRTPKTRTAAPVLTISSVTQAYAVFPERLEVISQSNLMKIVGRIGGELVAIEGRLRDSGWALIMPETPEAGSVSPPVATPLVNMMKWVTAVHDVFGLYGRPGRYNWDEKDARSLFFAYPRGTERNRLFLELDDALVSDHRVGNLPQIRSRFVAILSKKRDQPSRPLQSPQSPARQQDQLYDDDSQRALPRQDQDYRLPPLSFDQNGSGTSPHVSEHSMPRSLSPITERSDLASRNNSQRTTQTERQVSGSSIKHPQQGGSGSSKLPPAHEQSQQLETINDADTFGGTLTDEPHSKSPSGIASPDSSLYATNALPPLHSPEEPGMDRSGTLRTQTGESVYSQSTGVTPTPILSQAPSPTKAPTSASVPVVLPGSTPKPTAASTNFVPVPASSQPSSGMFSPILAAPLPSTATSSLAPRSTGDSPQSIHSPTPRRVASTEFKADKLMVHEEPAAQYLMNVVEEPRASPLSSSKEEKPRPTIITDFSTSPPAAAPTSLVAHTTAGKQNESLGRKPSGARAPPPKKVGSVSRLGSVDDASPISSPPPAAGQGHAQERSGTMVDIGEDAQAFLAYADQPSSAVQAPVTTSKPVEEEARGSSFAPSRAAADRRAKAEVAAAESQRAMNVPGGGKRAAGGKQTWSDEDDDEDDDDQPDSPVVTTARMVSPPGSHHGGGPAHVTSSPPPGEDYASTYSNSVGRAGLRALPPVPQAQDRLPGQNHIGHDLPQPPFTDRPRSRSPAQYQQQQQQQQQHPSRGPQIQMPQLLANQPPPAARQNIWNANFAAGHGMPEASKSGKFVELEEPQAKLTQAFAPHGLLQAGMQDKEDRSAKKQEELAREMGSSLVNVPSKPPPPSAGLLGAVTQHEKERKNAGGIGATLTDREREKRLAEGRQREIEKLQQQQADHMRQFGDFGQGGQQGFGGYGMGMPMGMGMPNMGFNPYQGGYNPYAQQQAMFAAQMAYQNAMMMSAAGSQAGDPGAASPNRPSSPTGGSQYGYPGGGMPGHQSPFPGQMPYGWPGAMPWMSPGAPGSPGMPGMMGMSSFPSMPSFGPHTGGMGGGGDYLHPGGYGQQQPGSGHGTPFDQRSRVDSFHSGRGSDSRGRSEDRQGGAPAS